MTERLGLRATRPEIEEKERRSKAFMDEHGLSALCFTTSKNFAWISCGGDNHVELTNRKGAATVVITPEDKYLVTSNIEAGRVVDEEVEGQGFTVMETPWHDDRRFDMIRELAGRGTIGTDLPFAGAEMMDDEISPMRYSLTTEEVERYKEVGRLTGAAIERACDEVEPGQTEHEIGSMLAGRLLSSGVVPAVVLIAVDDRIERYRHPIPTEKKASKYAMLVTCGRKWGLIASATRLVHFGRVPEELSRKHQACTKIDSGLIARTKQGEAISGLLARAQEDYSETGYPDQWRYHHQGGPTGYQTRDFLATPSVEERVRANHAFAWNPSITGTKSEDTIISTEDGPVILTQTGKWPLIEHDTEDGTVKRPDIKEV
jgi:Xaa-Pro aminopeptidase